MTQGAVMRSQRRAASKVSVRQRRCGTLAISRAPMAQRPCRRVMLVFAQVSSMKTRRFGSIRPWYFFHCARRRATSGRSCSAACRLFFEGQLLGPQEVPDRLAAHPDATRQQLRLHAAKRQIRLRRDPLQQPRPLTRQPQRPVSPAHRRSRSLSAACVAPTSQRWQRSPGRAEPSPGNSGHLQPTPPPAREDQENKDRAIHAGLLAPASILNHRSLPGWTTLPCRSRRAGHRHTPRQLHREARAHPETTRSLPARMAGLDMASNPFAKIRRIRSSHDPPPTTVNHKTQPMGIPRFRLPARCSSYRQDGRVGK